ncbi:MAG: hypothetical protein M1837_001508 [Sclerophora amabilis]|nr:MAG: hypothetical protein M1837_001508 [Sclerophora amabilis]
MKYAKNERIEDLNIGTVPVIFVVHSMGGLIVKEAYIQGQHDPEYETIVKAISAIIFLSTPHRGTNLADTLNHILQASFISAPKQYIADLTKNSFALQKLNEQFRHIAPRLRIVSFYETRATPIGFKRNQIMVLSKDSSVLGYPGEVSKALDADHHGVCKFDSPEDPGYVSIRNVLKTLVGDIERGLESKSSPEPAESLDAEIVLAVSEQPDVDYIFFRDRWTPGTCEWILRTEPFLAWLHDSLEEPRVLWLHGGPASGKSVLSSYIINHLVLQEECCQYFFIRFVDRNKRTVNSLLRSIAFQLAQNLTSFRNKIVQLSGEAEKLKDADAWTFWQRIFRSILFKSQFNRPLYWVIDGLDESDSPPSIINLISEILSASVPIHILIVSRETNELSSSFQKLPKRSHLQLMTSEGHLEDITCFLSRELNWSVNPEFKTKAMARILADARRNFLWVHLAVQRINPCHTEADVERVLDQWPAGMEALYDRMALSIADKPREDDKRLASNILAWVTCALRLLTVEEISQAMDKASPQMLDFQHSIGDLCGGFVVVDNGGYAAMVHQTAREYLLGSRDRPISVDREVAHEQLFMRCMLSLMTLGLRTKLNRGHAPGLLDYAATSWFSHLKSSSPSSEAAVTTLIRFLKGSWVLTWIQSLAQARKLRVLIYASTSLSSFAQNRKRVSSGITPLGCQMEEQQIIEGWATDLVKIAGKFGKDLIKNPESIYKLIPPFCPRDSFIFQLFGRKESKALRVTGFLNTCWDDSLTHLSFGSGNHATAILAAGSHVVALINSRKVLIYHTASWEETGRIQHGESVLKILLNSSGTLLVTYGYVATKVWNISTGNCIASGQNPAGRPRPQTLVFTDDDRKLLVGTQDKQISSMLLCDSVSEWRVVARIDEQPLDGTFINSPTCMALSPDSTHLAFGYRGHPVSAWEVEGVEPIGHCYRVLDSSTRSTVGDAWGEVIQLNWHPNTGEILGLYLEGIVFKWHPYDDEVKELRTGANKMVISHQGDFFATGDAFGNIKLFRTADFCFVYQFASQDPVFDLTFSSDTRRVYDVRGSYGIVWEPNVLLEHSELTERRGDFAGPTKSLTRRLMSRMSPVTALAAAPRGPLYCSGTEEGVTELFEAERGKISELGRSRSFMTTEEVTWSEDGHYVGFADLNGTLFVKSVRPVQGGAERWTVEPRLEIPIDVAQGSIRQILFHPDSRMILVYTGSTTSIVSLESNSVIKSRSTEPSMPKCKWVNHPTNRALLLAFAYDRVQLWQWDGLVEILSFCFTSPIVDGRFKASSDNDNLDSPRASPSRNQDVIQKPPKKAWEAQDGVERVMVTLDKRYILVQTMRLTRHGKKQKDLFLFETASIRNTNCHIAYPEEGCNDSGSTATQQAANVIESHSSQNNNHPEQLHAIPLPSNIASRIEIPLCFLAHDRLVFLDQNFWLCSWRLSIPTIPSTRRPSSGSILDDGGPEIKQHYFLPGDWISPDCVALCTVMADGTLLCPRNGEVAAVKCSSLGA